MMLYQNRQFVGMREAYDFLDEGGFVMIKPDEALIPAVFAPIGAKIYGEPIIRMGVLGAYTMQKAIYQWFTSDRTIEIIEGDWLEAIPPTIMNVAHGFSTLVIFETAKDAYAGLLTVPSGENTREDQVNRETATQLLYGMKLTHLTPDRELISDAIIAYGDRCAPVHLKNSALTLPLEVMGQLVTWLFTGDQDIELYQWAPSATDQLGLTETLVPKCTHTQLVGYNAFIADAPTPQKQFLN